MDDLPIKIRLKRKVWGNLAAYKGRKLIFDCLRTCDMASHFDDQKGNFKFYGDEANEVNEWYDRFKAMGN